MGSAIRKLVWPLLIIVTAIALGELWARDRYADLITSPDPIELTLPNELIQPDPVLGQHFRPNAHMFFASPQKEFQVNYQINEIGLRDSGMLSSGPRQPLVVFLGGAIVEGWGIMPEATFVLEMQRRIRFQKDAKIFPRILNAGMTGFGAAQSYLLGKQLISAYQPDLIVFTYSGLMPVHDFRFLQHATLDDNGLVVNAGQRKAASIAPQSDEACWLERSVLYRLAKSSLGAIRTQSDMKLGDPSVDLFAAARSNDNLTLHETSLRHVKALAEFAGNSGTIFILLHVPLPHQVAADEWTEGRVSHGFEARQYPIQESTLIERFCEENSIVCLVSGPMLEKLAVERSSRVFFRYDYSFTEVGHTAMVDYLIDDIRQALGIAPAN